MTTKLYGKNKDYVSYSALRVWKESRDLYRRKYYDGQLDTGTVYTRFGKRVAEILEKRDFTDFPELHQIPHYPISEQSIEIELEGIKVKGYLDLFDPATNAFGEVKTGIANPTKVAPWSRVTVRKHEQLPFYSLLIKKKFGTVTNRCNLIWLETRFIRVEDTIGSRRMDRDSDDLELTGKMKIFPRSIYQWERDRIEQMIINTANEIAIDYESYR